MRQVLAVSRFDFSKLSDWTEVVDHLRCGDNHDLHVVTTKSVESEVLDHKAQLEDLFQSVTIHAMDIDPPGGWPYAPNVFFWHAARFMGQNPNLPWQLNELDCLPLRTNSLDGVAGGYASCGKPFFGYVGPTPWRNQETGKITPSRFGKEDQMMSGCAVYPGDLFLRPNFASKNDYGLMSDFMKGTESTDEPWDMHLRSAMRADGMAHTESIAQHWNTGNYRIENGAIVCDTLKDHEIYAKNPDWERRECGGLVHPSAMMIHGCKDDSLKKLILANKIPRFVAVQKREKASVSMATTEAPPDKVSALETKVDDLASMFKQFMSAQLSKPLSAGHADLSKAAPPISSPTVSGAATGEKNSGGNSYTASGSEGQTGQISSEGRNSNSTISDDEGLWPKIRKMLEIQKWKITDLVIASEMPEDNLRELLSSKNYEVKQGGWVKKAELQTV